MPLPEIKFNRIGISFRAEIPVERARMTFSRIWEREDTIKAEMHIEGLPKSGEWGHVARQSINILSPRAKQDIALLLDKRWALNPNREHGYEWYDIIEKVSDMVITAYRQGEKEVLIEAGARNGSAPPNYLVEPLLWEGQPTLLFTRGGMGKTWVAQIISLVCALPWRDNPLGLKIDKQVNVLYLDYEANRASFDWRTQRLVSGNDLPVVPIIYRRCFRPFTEDYEVIQGMVDRYKIGLIVVDSVGIAAAKGMEMKDARTATAMYECLRQLGVAALLIHHTSKGKSLPGETKTSFGTVYFENEARSVIYLLNEYGADHNVMDLGFINTKTNDVPKFKPFAWRLKFLVDKGPVKVENASIREMATATEHLKVHQRLQDILSDGTPRTVKELADAVGKSADVVRTVLKRFKHPDGVPSLFVAFGRNPETWANAANIEMEMPSRDNEGF